jgi:hypothetical protein
MKAGEDNSPAFFLFSSRDKPDAGAKDHFSPFLSNWKRNYLFCHTPNKQLQE